MPTHTQARLEFSLGRAFRHVMYAYEAAGDCGEEGLREDLGSMMQTLAGMQEQMLRAHARHVPRIVYGPKSDSK